MLLDSIDLRSECLRTLDNMRGYGENWDGYSGVPFSPKDIEIAEKLVISMFELLKLSRVDPEDFHIGPCSDGAIMVFMRFPSTLVSVEVSNEVLTAYVVGEDLDKGRYLQFNTVVDVVSYTGSLVKGGSVE